VISRCQIQIGIVDRPQGRHRPGILDDDDILALAGQVNQLAELAARFGYGTGDHKISLIVHQMGMQECIVSDRRPCYRSYNGYIMIDRGTVLSLMPWNWQKPEWPRFSWDKTRLWRRPRKQFLLETGVIVGTVKHLGQEDREQLTVESMSTEALTTSEIEGEILDRASVQSSIRKQLGWPRTNGGRGRQRRESPR
jgi:hypothetical protein